MARAIENPFEFRCVACSSPLNVTIKPAMRTPRASFFKSAYIAYPVIPYCEQCETRYDLHMLGIVHGLRKLGFKGENEVSTIGWTSKRAEETQERTML